MPRKGYKSITVPDRVFDYFKNDYDANKEAYAIKGVRSFSGYISRKLDELMTLEQKTAKQAKRGTRQP